MGTKLTFVIEYGLPYSVLGKVIDKLMIAREMKEGIERGLQKLKSLLEKWLFRSLHCTKQKTLELEALKPSLATYA